MKLPEIDWIPLKSFGALMRWHFKNNLRAVRSFERRWRRAMGDGEIISRAVSERRFDDSVPHQLSGNDWRGAQIDWTHGWFGYGHRGGPNRYLFGCVELQRATLTPWLEKNLPAAFPVRRVGEPEPRISAREQERRAPRHSQARPSAESVRKFVDEYINAERRAGREPSAMGLYAAAKDKYFNATRNQLKEVFRRKVPAVAGRPKKSPRKVAKKVAG